MKNIHVIATDKPSRLFLNKVNSRLLLENMSNPSLKNILPSGSYQNIYITSDEEINEGDWYFFNVGYASGIKKADKRDIEQIHLEIEPKKIILTTDQDLIKDGVHAIDDEFLEWFVNNPSCEYVTVEDYGNLYNFRYLILFPKEEPKQELNLNCLDCNDSLQDCTCIEDTINMTQETLTEAAENMWLDPMKNLTSKMSFIAGAKWQQERMYSEEDMKKAIRFGFDKGFCSNSSNKVKNNLPSEKEWFEQFKKK